MQPKTFKFHFFPWHRNPEYTSKPGSAIITQADEDYFAKIEIEMDTLISEGQKAWYINTRDGELGGDQSKMWRKYPSTPDECWMQSTEGRYFARQLTATRTAGRICKLEYDPYRPVDTFWDIGSRDGTGIWLMQSFPEDRATNVLAYIEGWEQGYTHYVRELTATGWRFGMHYLPHDAGAGKQAETRIITAEEMLRQIAPSWSFTVPPRIQRKMDAIDLTRKHFSKLRFDEKGCKEGLIHLSNYQARYNTVAGAFTEEPLKNEATKAADSLQQ